jgi:hypothetical protein
MNMTFITRNLFPAVCVLSGAAVAISGSDAYGWFLAAGVFFAVRGANAEG